MSEPKSPPRAPARASVLDPKWEDELRRGQEAEGEAGSVDAELAYVHLLRHARAPETLEPDELDALWSDLDAELWPARTPWWRKAWVWWMAPAAAAAAVLFVVVVNDGQDEQASLARSDAQDEVEQSADEAKPAPPAAEPTLSEERAPADGSVAAAESRKREARGSGAAALDDEAEGGERSPQLSALRANFVRLAPNGRRAIRVSVDQSRDQLRAELLDLARGGG